MDNKHVLYIMTQQWYKMLWRVFLCVGFLILFACGSEDGPIPGPEPEELEEEAYLSFGIKVGDALQTKAWGGLEEGTLSERYVQSVRVVLYSGKTDAAVVVKSMDYDIKSTDGGAVMWTGADLAPTTNLSRTDSVITSARKVPYQDYEMLVIVNPTSTLKSLTAETKTLGEFLAKQQLTVDDVSISKNFVMTNSDDLVHIDKNSNLWDTKNQAHNNPVVVSVERMVAKVTLKVPGGGTQIPVDKTGAFAESLTWDLDVTNKWTFWMRVGVDGSTSRKDWYAKDPNYDGLAGTAESLRINEFFYYLTQGNTPAPFLYALDNSRYCLENTMDPVDQGAKEVTTRVLVRCMYKPVNVAAIGDGYCVIKRDPYPEEVYTLENAKTLQQTVLEKIAAGVARTNQEIFMEAAINEGYDFSSGGIPRFGGSNVTSSFQTINAGVRYYHGGVSYYAIRILHFGDSDSTSPIPGHYGVLRNTHYTVTLEKLLGPGAINLEATDISTRSEITDDILYRNISAKIERQ